MAPYSNDALPNPYVGPTPTLPNIPFPEPYWINKLRSMLWVGCTNPDLFAFANALGSAAEAFWAIETPSTKQIITEVTGLSWICGAKTVIRGANPATPYAVNDLTGRAMYGSLVGQDTLAYSVFVGDVIGDSIGRFFSQPMKLKRTCNGTQSPYVGITPVGGWPAPGGPDWAAGWAYFNANGDRFGDQLQIKAGQVGIMIGSIGFTGLFTEGGCNTTIGIQNRETGEILDIDTVDNFGDPNRKGVVSFFSPEGRFKEDTILQFVVRINASIDARVVPTNGRGYIRAFSPGASDAPPYFSMQHMLKANDAS